MRKLLILFLCIASVFLLCSCGKSETSETREAVVINLPKDDSVNGYRTGKADFSDDTVISADLVGVDNSSNKNNTTDKTQESNSKGSYCANKNSGVFHKIDCGSVSNMKEENKSYFNDRQQAVQGGYKPCGRCKP